MMPIIKDYLSYSGSYTPHAGDYLDKIGFP